jgi:ketosteroid isomerase-like protein
VVQTLRADDIVTASRPSSGGGVRRVAALAVFLAPVFGPVGCTAGDTVQAAREEIREVTRRWESALVAGDPAGAVDGVFTEDALRMPSGEPAVRGRRAISAALAGSVALAEVRFELDEIDVDGGLAYAAGTYRVRASEGEALSGKFLEVWKHTAAGWRIHRVMWD